MSEIRLVAPFTALCSHNQRLLNLLKQKLAPVSGPLPVLRVPVRLDVDVAGIIEENDRKIAENGVQSVTGQSKDTKDVSGQLEDVAEDSSADEMPPSYVELGDFQPKNRLEQITTVFFQDFPALKTKYVDKVFLMVLQACPLDLAKEFRFSVIAESINDTRGVFVRFPTVQLTQWAQKAMTIVFTGITAVFDERLDSLATAKHPENRETVSLTTAATNIALIFANKKLYSQGSGRSGTEDLDEVMQYYKTYKVENSELVEVPKELKEGIVKDIIKFRAKVLTIEREARRKEMERERRRAKARLTLIFEGIRSAAAHESTDIDDKMGDISERKDGDDPNLDTEAAAENPLDALSEQEYLAYIEAQENQEMEAQYALKHKEMLALEKQEKTQLLDRIHAARGYEQALVENKLAHMDEVKMFQDLETQNLAVSGKMKLYYTNHGEYLRMRSHERNKEEQMDALDRAEEAQKAAVKVPTSATFKATTIAIPAKKEPPVSVANSSVIVSTLSGPELAAVKEKIANLVEEFLGIREDLLIDFIYEFVLAHGLARDADLVTELQETLDDDSRTVVDQLHAFIASLRK